MKTCVIDKLYISLPNENDYNTQIIKVTSLRLYCKLNTDFCKSKKI